MSQTEHLITEAKKVLRDNDLGGYTVPTKGLYPFQWNWDAGITALGWLYIDERRAWTEFEMLFEGQWKNGMVPHVVFHQDSDDYFPGPDQWGVKGTPSTTSISQPPLLSTMIRIIYEQSMDKELAKTKLNELLPKLIQYHEWWYRERDPESTGLVSSYHPWESGMDNSPAWDDVLARVPQVQRSYQRRDLNHVDSDQRPLKEQYDRYIYLVDFFRDNEFDYQKIYDNCPFHIKDISLNAVLQRGTKDIIYLNTLVSESYDLEGLEKASSKADAALNALWDQDKRVFLNKDNALNKSIGIRTSGGFMPLYSHSATVEQAKMMADEVKKWLVLGPKGLASTHPLEESFDSKRYWRGPSWLHINWMIADGLKHYGHDDVAEELRLASRSIIDQSGYWEYFDPITGEGCGGSDFSWTAAIALHWLL
ncbi:MGH1-like glycoside hydrolase domain-containing protein [Marinomonas sp. 2405UD68-3]|uniref:MGH1-like glycoside hydrolase domain-containing protein n=1 Tax=Marinomonas sp. 2405UD68-3 TaxID=3391835 RepID=UPI0039C8F0FD